MRIRSVIGRSGRVLITGASKGIGKAIAAHLSSLGYEVIGTCRNPAKIPSENRLPKINYLPLELTDPSSISSLVKLVGEVDVLILNAGCSQNGPVEETPVEKMQEYFEINFFSAVRLIQGFLPGMRVRKKGIIINISSMASKSPVPFSTFYASSKAALNALSLGLQHETRPFGIKVVTIAPFEIKTDLPQDFQTLSSSDYFTASSRVKKARDHSLAQAVGPEAVAELVGKILACKHPRYFYPVGKNAPFKAVLIKLLPYKLVAQSTLKRYGLR